MHEAGGGQPGEPHWFMQSLLLWQIKDLAFTLFKVPAKINPSYIY